MAGFGDLRIAGVSRRTFLARLGLAGAAGGATGLGMPAFGWAEDEANRLNPANGLCLSATYDAAFDRHLISFDEDCRLIFSPALAEFYGNQTFQTQFKAFEGRPIAMPKRFRPDRVFLRKHREKMPQ